MLTINLPKIRLNIITVLHEISSVILGEVSSYKLCTHLLFLPFHTHVKLHNEELHNLYTSPNIIRRIKSRIIMWARHVARMGEERKVYKVLVRETEGKRPLGRPRRRWEDVIRMDLRKIVWGRRVNSVGSG
jgi:hypothetical protein